MNMASHRTVIKNWVAQTGKSTRGSRVFYDGPVIFSYGRHHPLARLELDASGKVVRALVNTKRVSRSTSRHLTYVRTALLGVPVEPMY